MKNWKSTITKFIGMLMPILILSAPSLGIEISGDVQAGMATFGAGIQGVLTNGFGATTSAVFTTVTGLVPFIGWIVALVFHWAIAPAVFVIVAIAATVVIAKHDNLTDLPDWVNTMITKRLGIEKQ